MILKTTNLESDPSSDAYWNDLRSADYSKSFEAVKTFIHQKSVMMKDRPRKQRNRIVWVLAALLPLLIFFSCKRKTYVEPQGITLSFVANDSMQSTIDFLLQQYAEKKWKSILRPHGGTIHGVIYAPAESYGKLKAIAEKLKSSPGVTDVFLSAISTTINESLLSRLSYKFLNLHIGSTGPSDEELRIEMATKLKEAGLDNLKLELTSYSGRKQIRLLPDEKTNDFAIDLVLTDGTNITLVGEKW